MLDIEKQAIRTVEGLIESNLIDEADVDKIQKVATNFSLAISPEMVTQINPNDPTDPIGKQFVPDQKELYTTPEELTDPIGDNTFSPVKGIVHRYPDRCLFMPITVCPVYCRFCFRREKVGSGENGLNRKEMENALSYIESHKELWEVILTGGDPLYMSFKRLEEVISRLQKMDHIKVLRIHTRVPVVDPKRVTEKLVQLLKLPKALYVVLHTNHSNEFTENAKQAIAQIVDAGVPMLSQSVLLKGVNADKETMTALMKTLVENRIKPYYLHHGDYARGTSHFRTTIEEGQRLMRDLQGTISGLCQPTYTLDIPGGYGKVPVGHSYISKEDSDGIYLIEDRKGEKHRYRS